MSKINTTPRGLQEFLGNTSQGVNPSDLNLQVSPTIDLSPFLSVDKLKSTTDSRTFTAGGAGLLHRVPEGEVWIPVQLGMWASGLTVGDVVEFTLEVWDPASQRVALVAPHRTTTIGSNPFATHGFTWPERIALPSGWACVALVNDTTLAASPETVNSTLFYHEMKA